MKNYTKYFTIVADFGEEGTASYLETESLDIALREYSLIKAKGTILKSPAFNGMSLKYANEISLCIVLNDKIEIILNKIELQEDKINK